MYYIFVTNFSKRVQKVQFVPGLIVKLFDYKVFDDLETLFHNTKIENNSTE